MNDTLALAREFVAIQSSLLASLDETHPFLALADVDRLPKAGTIVTTNGDWTFRRHGAGVRFVSSGGVVIDAHRAVAVTGGIDAWRLSRYLSSIQKIDVSHRPIEAQLSELLRRGDLCLSSNDKEIYELKQCKDKGANSSENSDAPASTSPID